jgi:hypothetical protein
MRLAICIAMTFLAVGCGNVESDPDGGGGSADADTSADAAGPDATGQVCTPDAPLRCDGDDLIVCTSDGTGERAILCTIGCDPSALNCNACVPNTSTCEQDQVTVCDGDGQVVVDESGPCPLGCHTDGERCVDVDPSNGMATHLDAVDGEGPLVLDGDATINTDDGSVTNDGNDVTVSHTFVAAPGNGVAMRVIKVGSLTISGTVDVNGSNALVIVSDGDVEISGSLSVASTGAPGPGAWTAGGACEGGDGGTGQVNAGGLISVYSSGGGGGGFGSAGARGGNVSGDISLTGGSAGGTTGNAALTPLRGGCPGGSGGDTSRFGGGGGAVHIVSRTSITVQSGGMIDAGGGAARPPFIGISSTNGGGGSGGAILLEAPTVTIEGILAANGAGGGCNGAEAQHGQTGSTAAQGGNCTSSSDGGRGATRVNSAAPGELYNTSGGMAAAGSGGGGVGRIRINTPTFNDSGNISPTESTGTLGTR